MVAVTTDPGEALFERYLKANGYDVLAYEPDLGTTKRPDYLVGAAGQDVVVEVESFNTPPMPLTPRSGFVNMTPKLKTVRNKITAGSTTTQGDRGPSARRRAGEPAQLVGAAGGPRVHRCPVRRLAGQLHA
jgi:hypothetical protein